VRCIQGFVGETEGMRLLGRGEMYTGFCLGDWGNETTGER